MKAIILVINPGSTSTKIALYENDVQLWKLDIEHRQEDLKRYSTVYEQLDFRLQTVLLSLKEKNTDLTRLSCVISRGGLLPPLESGAYIINPEMLDVLEKRPVNHHASNLGAAMAYRIAMPLHIPAYIYDPVTVDEMIDVARITGLKGVLRHGQGHNLNMRAAAIRYCSDRGLDYTGQTLIVAHLGGGTTLTLQRNGRIIDMISDDEGPFSPERAGLIPCFRLAKLIEDKGYSYPEIMQVLQRRGGLTSLIGESDARIVEKMIQNGDAAAELAYDAMALGVARGIGRLAVLVSGEVDQIILTGGIAFSEMFTGKITNMVRFISPVTVLPGENEMQALANGAYRVLSGKETAKEYKEPNSDSNVGYPKFCGV